MKKISSLALVALVSSASVFYVTHYQTEHLSIRDYQEAMVDEDPIVKQLRQKQREVERARMSRRNPEMSFSIHDELDDELF